MSDETHDSENGLEFARVSWSTKRSVTYAAPVYRPNESFVPGSPPLTTADFSKRVLIVHFWAAWNGIDIPMDRELSAVRPDYEGRISFRSCDTERPENLEFCTRVPNLPALGCYINGTRVKIVIGLRKAVELPRLCDECLVAAFEPAEI